MFQRKNEAPKPMVEAAFRRMVDLLYACVVQGGKGAAKATRGDEECRAPDAATNPQPSDLAGVMTILTIGNNPV